MLCLNQDLENKTDLPSQGQEHVVISTAGQVRETLQQRVGRLQKERVLGSLIFLVSPN